MAIQQPLSLLFSVLAVVVRMRSSSGNDDKRTVGVAVIVVMTAVGLWVGKTVEVALKALTMI